jgi:hypothetical protein
VVKLHGAGWIIVAGVALAGPPVAAQSQAVAGNTPIAVALTDQDPIRTEILQKDAIDLADMLTGRWDNEVQIFFEPELNLPASARHERLHVIVRPIEGGPFGDKALFVEYRKGGESGSVLRQRIWTLSPDAALGGVRLTAFSAKGATLAPEIWREPAKLSALKRDDFVPVTGCDLIWRRRAEGFAGETRAGQCKLVTTDAAASVLTVNERHDLSPNVWEVRDIGVDARGVRAFGSAEFSPSRLRRANAFVCWVAARKGEEIVTMTDLVLHDQGGSATAQLQGASPGVVRLRLRNVDWPIGQNRPSLTLYMLTGTNLEPKGYAWGEPDAKRLALDIGGTQASCTRDDRALWR